MIRRPDPLRPASNTARSHVRRGAVSKATEGDSLRDPSDSNLPVPAGPVITHAPEPDAAYRAAEAAAFAAQRLAGGERRGLKGGPETLERARTTYLGAEYSGTYDRRTRKGSLTKKDI
ncbi:MAG: hypothetical protein ACK41P_08720 [Asticcacaulis sp.]